MCFLILQTHVRHPHNSHDIRGVSHQHVFSEQNTYLIQDVVMRFWAMTKCKLEVNVCLFLLFHSFPIFWLMPVICHSDVRLHLLFVPLLPVVENTLSLRFCSSPAFLTSSFRQSSHLIVVFLVFCNLIVLCLRYFR